MNKNIIFISIPKTGTISVRQSLGLDTKFNHHTSLVIRQKLGQENWDDSFKFTFIRNPFDRLVSWYFFHRDTQNIALYKKYNFKDWIFAGCPNHWTEKTGANTLDPLNLHHYILDENGNTMVDFIGRVENINADFNKLLNIMGRPKAKLLHKNKSKRQKYRSYYDNDSKREVEKLFEKDLELFKYNF